MRRVRLGRDSTKVCRLLEDLGRRASIPADLRQRATNLAGVMRPTMDRRQVQEIAWLLQDAGARRSLPARDLDTVRYWAAYLEGRV